MALKLFLSGLTTTQKMGGQGGGNVEVKDLLCPLAWEDVLVGWGEPAVAIGAFPAVVGFREDTADRVGSVGAGVGDEGVLWQGDRFGVVEGGIPM